MPGLRFTLKFAKLQIQDAGKKWLNNGSFH